MKYPMATKDCDVCDVNVKSTFDALIEVPS